MPVGSRLRILAQVNAACTDLYGIPWIKLPHRNVQCSAPTVMETCKTGCFASGQIPDSRFLPAIFGFKTFQFHPPSSPDSVQTATAPSRLQFCLFLRLRLYPDLTVPVFPTSVLPHPTCHVRQASVLSPSFLPSAAPIWIESVLTPSLLL